MSATDLVLLRGGISVPVAPYLLLLDMEARGITVRRDGADLLVGPPKRLTPEDDRALRTWKTDLLRLLKHMERQDSDAHLFTDVTAEPHSGTRG